MNIRENPLLLRWPVLALAALAIIVVEVVEHRPGGLSDLDSDFVRKALVFGVGLLLMGGVALGALARKRSGSAPLARKTNGRTAQVQNVLIVESQLLLGAGVQSLLTGETGLEVFGISVDDDGPGLLEEIRQFGPDVVVVDEMTHLSDPIILLALLEDYPELRVLVVSVNDNLVRVYDKQQVKIAQAADLIHVICGCKSPV